MLIGISGLAGSGKDTAADFLAQKGLAKVSFSDPMKRICADVYKFSFDQLWGPSEMRNAPDERYPRRHTWIPGERACPCCGVYADQQPNQQCYLTPRYALQLLGSEWGRECYPNTWVDYCIDVADKLEREGGYSYFARHGLRHDWKPGEGNWKTSVVVPDVRFKNEIEALKARGAKLIRIVRKDAGLTGVAAKHGSETEQASIEDEFFDGIIFNNKGLDWLYARVNDLLADWDGG